MPMLTKITAPIIISIKKYSKSVANVLPMDKNNSRNKEIMNAKLNTITIIQFNRLYDKFLNIKIPPNDYQPYLPARFASVWPACGIL